MSPCTGVIEVSECSIYDETLFHPDQKPRWVRSLFTLPVGSSDWTRRKDLFTKSFLQTNLVQAAVLDAPKSFVIRRLNALFLTEDRPLRIFETSAYRNTLISLRINMKNLWEGPAWMCASPLALFDSPAEEITEMKDRYGIEWPKVGASFPAGIEIRQQESFIVNADFQGEIEEPISLAVYLDGQMFN
jgi:hypothetical protein